MGAATDKVSAWLDGHSSAEGLVHDALSVAQLAIATVAIIIDAMKKGIHFHVMLHQESKFLYVWQYQHTHRQSWSARLRIEQLLMLLKHQYCRFFLASLDRASRQHVCCCLPIQEA